MKFFLLQREKTAGSKCIISMEGSSTTITNPESGDSKTFVFDHSYWSHDDCTETDEGIFKPQSDVSTYADQVRKIDLSKVIGIVESMCHFKRLLNKTQCMTRQNTVCDFAPPTQSVLYLELRDG